MIRRLYTNQNRSIPMCRKGAAMVALYVFCCCGSYGQPRTIEETLRSIVQVKHPGSNVDSQEELLLPSAERSQANPTSGASCPSKQALDLFRHQIAYERTEESDPLKGLSVLHANVWTNDSITAFYIRDQLNGFVPDVRMTYVFSDRYLGRYTCPLTQGWEQCVEKSPDIGRAGSAGHVCTTNVDLSAVPVWAPSANNDVKRKIASELRTEIEGKWKGAEEIVVRDFNLRDPQITAYIKMPDGDYFQGCAFEANVLPHCTGWHLFGQVPDSEIRSWIFERPYRLK